MMRHLPFLLVMVSMAWVNGVAAEVPTAADMKAYMAFQGVLDTPEIMSLLETKEEVACFAEHVCAAEGTIGQSLGCEHDLEVCLDILRTEGITFDPRSFYAQKCAAFFEAMTPAQNALISSPIGCEVPPPATALNPSMTSGEVECIANQACTSTPSVFGSEELCRKRLNVCAKSLAKIKPARRASCRTTRALELLGEAPRLSPNGPCPSEMQDPVLAPVPEATLHRTPIQSIPSSRKNLDASISHSKTEKFHLGNGDNQYHTEP